MSEILSENHAIDSSEPEFSKDNSVEDELGNNELDGDLVNELPSTELTERSLLTETDKKIKFNNRKPKAIFRKNYLDGFGNPVSAPGENNATKDDAFTKFKKNNYHW